VIDYETALELVLKHVRPCPDERVPTGAAAGRVLAEDVVARIASPPFDKAAMDGYAVRREDLVRLPAELAVVGEVFAGQPPGLTVGPGQAALIMTGAPVPVGADMVVMLEDTERPAEGRARIRAARDANICPAGEDVQAGQTVLRAGEELTPLRVGVAAAAGWRDLPVRGRPAAALLCTGSEVVEPGSAVPEGKIYNSNGPMLTALMAPLCRRFTYLGIAADREEELTRAVRRGLEADLLVVSGGVSAGQYDLAPDILRKCGVEQVFHKVAIKPGKPVFFGASERSVAFGLPGNPLSCFVMFHMFLAPAIASMGGRPKLPPAYETGFSAETFTNKPERMNVVPCMVEEHGEGRRLRRCAWHGSADITGASGAEGLFLVPRGAQQVRAGEELRFFRI
jgi:molybdopterin molybdotransferase